MRTISKVTITCLGLAFMATAAQADLVASWGFQGTLSSDIGGAALVDFNPMSQNGFSTTTLYGQSRQVFNMVGSGGSGNNAGLQISSPNFLADNSNYSIEILFSQTNSPNTNGWRKIYDNSNRVGDQGLYVSPSSTMDYYPHSGGTAPIAANTFYNVVMTFNSSTNLTDIYVNGVLDSSLAASEANIADNSIPLSFFMDDAGTGFNEYSNSSVGLIRMWNTELSAGDVANIENNPFTAAPEPAPMAALGLGVIALVTRRRRTR